MVHFLLGHKILLVILAVLLAAGVWFGLTSSGPGGQGATLLTTENVAGTGPEKELVSTLLALRAVKLDGAIFTDPAFMSLRDFSTQIVPEAVGRPNPFEMLKSAIPTQISNIQNTPNFAKPSGNK